MSSTGIHPEEVELLRFADGELSARRAGEIRAHLQACWECRSGLEELNGVIVACVRYRKEVLHGHLPPPPVAWFDIRLRMEQMDAQRLPLAARVSRWLHMPAGAAVRWAPVAVALAVVAGIFYQLRETPAVQAAALLHKAVAAAENRPSKPRRIRIRTRDRQLIRLAGSPRPAAAATGSDALEARFRDARYDWEDPLSARSYQEWRDGLHARRDEVTSGPEGYRIQTTTPEGELASASLTLRGGDLSPVESRLEFRNHDWVEITEAPAEPVPPVLPGVVAGAPAAPRPAVPEPAPPAAPRPTATLVDELQVLAALHNVGADLGDPIEVARSAGQVVVSGVGLAPARQQQVQAALNGLPNVVVRFADPASEAAPPAAQPPSAAAAGWSAGPLQSRLEQQAGGRPRFERLASQLLDLNETVMARVYALRRLAQKFPHAAEAQLGTEDRRLLGTLNQEHATVIGQQISAMQGLLNPLLTALGGTAVPDGAPAPDSWQDAAEAAFLAARRVETLLAQTLGVAPGDGSTGDLPSDLLSATARLRASAESCRRLAGVGETRK